MRTVRFHLLMLLLFLNFSCQYEQPPSRILVFTKTAGFRHESIPAGVEALQRLGAENDFLVEHTENAADFRPENLCRYAAVVFLNTSGDVLDSAEELVALAGRRMEQGMAAGGNRIVAGDGPAAVQQLRLQRALELLAARRPDIVRPHLAKIGIELLPLLHLMNQDLGLNLPMAEIEHRLRYRAGQ